MKNLSKIALLAFAAISFTFTSCGEKKADEGTETTTEATEGTDTATEGDTAVVQDQPVQDGLVDSTATKQ